MYQGVVLPEKQAMLSVVILERAREELRGGPEGIRGQP
jgi:hypothetical protein